MAVALDRYPSLDPQAALERVAGQLMALGPDGKLCSFVDDAGERNEVGERIVELCDGARTVAQIAAALCEEFDVKASTARADAQAFVADLVEKRVLVLSEKPKGKRKPK